MSPESSAWGLTSIAKVASASRGVPAFHRTIRRNAWIAKAPSSTS